MISFRYLKVKDRLLRIFSLLIDILAAVTGNDKMYYTAFITSKLISKLVDTFIAMRDTVAIRIFKNVIGCLAKTELYRGNSNRKANGRANNGNFQILPHRKSRKFR